MLTPNLEHSAGRSAGELEKAKAKGSRRFRNNGEDGEGPSRASRGCFRAYEPSDGPPF